MNSLYFGEEVEGALWESIRALGLLTAYADEVDIGEEDEDLPFKKRREAFATAEKVSADLRPVDAERDASRVFGRTFRNTDGWVRLTRA